MHVKTRAGMASVCMCICVCVLSRRCCEGAKQRGYRQNVFRGCAGTGSGGEVGTSLDWEVVKVVAAQ
jgi:hypothetical protein